MSKILNWLFGSFFRTLGRLFAIFSVGVLLIFIGSKIGFKLPDFLMPMTIYADTTFDWGQVYQGKNYNNLTSAWIGDCNSSSCTIVDGEFNSINGSSTPTAGSFYGNTNSLTIASNGVMLAWLLNERVKSDYLYSMTTYVCSNKNLFSTDKRLYLDTSSTNVMARPTTMIYQNTGTSNINGQVSEGKSFNYCHAVSSLFVPNRVGSTFGMRIVSPDSSITGAYVYLIGYELESLGIYTDTVKEILEETLSTSTSGLATTQQLNQVANEIKQEQQSTTNAVEDVNDSVNNLNDSINNNDTSGAQGSANSFFDNFEDNDFGLSSILTAPLRAINAMLNDSCVAPSATYKGKTFSFPCGSMLWSRPGGEDFRTFVNIFYGGFLAYFVIRSLFLEVEKLKNPNNDKVEVQKL